MKLRPRYSPERRCAYCHAGGNLETCATCNCLIHLGCRVELGRCPTIGCSGVRSNSATEYLAAVQRDAARREAEAKSRQAYRDYVAIRDGAVHPQLQQQVRPWSPVGCFILIVIIHALIMLIL